MGLFDVVEDLGDLVTDVGKDVGQTVVDAVDVVGGTLADWAGQAGLDKLLLAATSPILAAGQAVIADMRESTGTGEPASGDQLTAGEQGFRGAAGVLTSARPNGDWTGAGSDAYAGADTAQQGRATTLAELDRQLHEVISHEAGQVKATRSTLDDQSNWLAEFGLTTFGYTLMPGVGQALKDAAELQAVLKALGVCATALQQLEAEVAANAAVLQRLAGQYAGVAKGIEAGGSYGGPPPGAAPGATPATDVPSGSAPSGGTGGSSGGGAGAGSGAGAGRGSGGGAPSGGVPSMPHVPTSTTPSSTAGRASGGSGGGMPSGLGSPPSGSGGTPAGGGGLASLIGEVIKAATQHASNGKTPEEQVAKDAEQAKADKHGKDDKDDKDDLDEGVAPASSGGPAIGGALGVSPGDGQHGRAPIHVELDVDPARLEQPMTVTLDRDHPIALPPTMTA